jgi:hypothetical protein
VLGRHQLLAMGFSKAALGRRLRAGRWARVYPGVYRIQGVPRTWHQQLMAACLWGGPGAVASHRSAAALWGFDGLSSEAIEIMTPRNLRDSSGLTVVHSGASMEQGDATRLGVIPTTTVVRTLFDLASVFDRITLQQALDSAVRNKQATIDRIRRRLDRNRAAGKRGPAMLRQIVEELEAGENVPESVLERRILDLLLAAGLPPPVCQYEIRDENGRLLARVDFAYPERRLAIEADGFKHHGNRRSYERDRARDSELAARGWTTLRFTWLQATNRPEEIPAKVSRALEQRGQSSR